MTRNNYLFLKAILGLVFCLSLAFGLTDSVQADTCTWDGDGNADWMLAGNWSCGHVPQAADTVNIPVVTTTYPVIYANSEYQMIGVSSLTIDEGAQLTVNNGNKGVALDAATMTINGTLSANTGDNSWVWLNWNGGTGSGVVNIGTTGTIIKQGATGDFNIYSTFNNAGSLIFEDYEAFSNGGVVLFRGGDHTGIFQGEWLQLGESSISGQVFNFNNGSQIRVNNLHALKGTVNIYGTYSQPANTGTSFAVQPSSGTVVVYFKTGAGILKVPEYFNINYNGKLILESQIYNYTMAKVNLDYLGELQNNGDLTITTQFNWLAGKLTGNGTTTVDTTATFTMGTSAYAQNDFILDSQTLVNNTTANWSKRDLNLANSANFINNGTFNANATTTMNGGESVTFTNHGNFFKNTAATTTTMNVGFINNGLVQVNAGSLVFPLGMDNGEDTTLNLNGGTLDPGDNLTLEVGDSLIGSGTLAANLVNYGTVSPGNSAGSITVDGDFTQQVDGVFEIQLGGTTAGTGHDQLIVDGLATMQGILNVSLLPGFTPQLGDTFFIIDHTTGTGTFETVNLPTLSGGLKLEAAFADPGVTLTVVDSGGSSGSISGTVTCGSTHTVFVDLFSDTTTPPPEDTVHIACGGTYSFTDLPNGTYYVNAWIDLNESGDGPPDPDEPTAWYGDPPTALSIIDGDTLENIDITIELAAFTLFLPLILK